MWCVVLFAVYFVGLLKRGIGLSCKIEVCRGPHCSKQENFDAHAALSALAAVTDSKIEVVASDCMNFCTNGPNAKCLVDGKAAIFGANCMNQHERERKIFSSINSDDRAKKIFRASVSLRDRLLAFEPPTAPIFPPPKELGRAPKPTSFFDGYSESELRAILHLHESLQDVTPPPSAPPENDNILDLHAAIQSFIEGQGITATEEEENDGDDKKDDGASSA